jgi:hypothetical protein
LIGSALRKGTGKMNYAGIPDIPNLMEATVELLQKGMSDSASMRQQLAARFKLDPDDEAWRKFVNNHAWALVRLQAQARIRKIAPGRYELTAGVTDATPPIREGEALPRWARVLVASATHKNAVRWSAEPFQGEDLIVLLEGRRRTLHVDQPAVPGNSSGRRQSAPSICAIARSHRLQQALHPEKLPLILQAVNFALNAWGDDVFLAIAEGAIRLCDAPAGPTYNPTGARQGFPLAKIWVL